MTLDKFMILMLLIAIIGLIWWQPKTCFKLEDLTSNEFYASYASTTAVWFTHNNQNKVLPLCEGHYTQK